MARIRIAALCVLALAVAFTGLPERPALAGGAPGERIRVLVLTGQNNHDCAFTSRLVESFLEKTGRFDVDVTDEPAKALADAEKLASYRCFFLDYNGERWGEKAEANFLAAVRGGTGVVVMHAANNSFPGWVEYEKLVGHVWRSEKGTGHGTFHPFDVDVDDRNHPITSGLPALVAHPDELYHRLVHMHDAPFRQLMSALSSKESGGTGRREPMATILRYGEGRIFHTPLGHVWRGSEASRRSLLDAQLQMLLARGTEWTATGAVTLAPEGFGLAFRSTFERDRAWLGRRVTLDGRPDVRLVVLDEHMTIGWDPASAGVIVAWSGGHERVEKAVGPGAPLDPALVRRGKPYARITRNRWFLEDATEKRRAVEPEFVRRDFHESGGRLSPVFVSRFPSGRREPIEVREWIEKGSNSPTSLQRSFTVTGLAEGESLRLNPEQGLHGPDARGACSYVSEADGTTRSGKFDGAGLILREGTTTVETGFEPSSDL